MTLIWKFVLEMQDSQRIEMPEGAQVLTVQTQGQRPCLWAVVDIFDGSLTEMRTFEIHGTGNLIENGSIINQRYIATFQQPPFVWHVFERLD
jgi:hypothetical protein